MNQMRIHNINLNIIFSSKVSDGKLFYFENNPRTTDLFNTSFHIHYNCLLDGKFEQCC
jgi:hypothetical protein